MRKKWTHKACFQFFGTEPTNPRWSWSARSPDGKTVAVTFWQDRFQDGGTIYTSTVHAGDERWLASPGRAELLRNLAWARDYYSGDIRIIIAIPKDPDASPRSIKECFPHPQLKMRVTHLNESIGEFVAKRIASH